MIWKYILANCDELLTDDTFPMSYFDTQKHRFAIMSKLKETEAITSYASILAINEFSNSHTSFSHSVSGELHRFGFGCKHKFLTCFILDIL